jgi:mRNA-degrading endonuclease RelE of RelBE toxin-antitoxin system
MKYEIKIKRKLERQVSKLPKNIQKLFMVLVEELKELGAVRTNWTNYSKLSKNEHHCHLTYRYVACWKEIDNTITIEVYYVGSREKAPY